MDILDEFIGKARESLMEGYYRRPAEDHPKKSLLGSLRQPDFTLICEIKHASPAGEYEFKEIDVERTALAFKENGAGAISVVVEPKIFRGDIANIGLAKASGLPVLFKDFVISEEQIIAAKNSGADAILLVVKVAKRMDLDLDALIDCAHRNRLEVLLESYDSDELKAAMKTDADVLGINNRDLRTLKVDIRRTASIIKGSGGIDCPLISESGIKTAADIRFVREAGARGALVGTAIWKARDLGEKISELKGGCL